MTLIFLFVIMGATDKRVPAGFAPIPIGLVLTLIHLISIPVDQHLYESRTQHGTGTVRGGWAFQQLWLFWLARIMGGVLGVYSTVG
jgi:aquaporin Z